LGNVRKRKSLRKHTKNIGGIELQKGNRPKVGPAKKRVRKQLQDIPLGKRNQKDENGKGFSGRRGREPRKMQTEEKTIKRIRRVDREIDATITYMSKKKQDQKKKKKSREQTPKCQNSGPGGFKNGTGSR